MHSSFGAFHMTLLALALAPATASASPSHASAAKDATKADVAKADVAKTCSKDPVEVVAGSTAAKITLTTCDGSAVPASVVQLSAMAKPAAATKVHKLDPRVAERLAIVADHFRKDGETPRIVLVPGTRARTSGSMHASGRAIDFKIEGVPNEDIAAFCKTMKDTGCGFYPTEGFVHVDVRDHNSGHVSWIDVSKAGDPPKYVTSWKPAPAPEAAPEKPEKKASSVTVIAAADEPKLPPLPAALAFAPLELTPPTVPAREAGKADEAPKHAALSDGAKCEAKAETKDVAPKTASKNESRRGKHRRHHHPAQSVHPAEQQ
jgi:uncharacterized protein YcbK (DUF882 family)